MWWRAAVDDNTDETTVTGGVFRYPLAQPVPTLDPAQITDATSSEVARQLYEGLVTYDIDLNIIPALASSWDISDDGTTYTFHLRDTQFSSGDPFTANDVKWSFEHILNPKTASPRTWILDEIVGSTEFMTGSASEVTGIEVVDDRTVKISIPEPSRIFLHKLTYSSAYILNRNAIEDKGETWYETPDGTGPFVLQEWKRDQKLILVPNEKYWGEKPHIDTLEYPVLKEDNVRQQEYEAGNIEYNLIPDADFERIKNDEKLSEEMIKVDQLSVQYIGFRTHIPPFNNKKLRQAFCYAVDRNDIIENIYKGRFKLATGVIPSAMPNYTSLTDAYPYDPTMAKVLLEEAIEEGVEIPETITLAYNKGTATHKNVAEFIQFQIKQNLGIELVLEEYEWATYLEQVDNGEFPMFRLAWIADYPDPDNFLWVLLDSANAGPKGGGAFYNNPEFDTLVRQAKTMMDENARMELYAQSEKIAMDDAAWMPVNFGTAWSVLKPYVKGFRITAMGTLPHNMVEIRK